MVHRPPGQRHQRHEQLFTPPPVLAAALLGLTLLPASAAASAPQTTLHYRGLEHIPLGVATAQPVGDHLVVSNIGSSGDDGIGLTISNIGSSGEAGAWSPSPQATAHEVEILSMDLSGSLLPGAQLEFSSTVMTAARAHIEPGVLVCRKAGGDAWELTAVFDGVTGYDLHVLLGGVVQAALPGQTGLVQAAHSPTRFGGGEYWFTDLRSGYSAGFEPPVGISIPNMGTILADELRFVPMDSPTGPGWSFDSFESFRFETDGIQSLTILGESSLLAESYCTATLDSTGQSAEIFANGSSSVAANDLVLLAGPVPNQFGVFSYGANQVAIPFGNGILCVGGPFHRLDVELATGNVLKHELDNTDPPGPRCEIFPGSTWNFAAWYRDPLGGGAFFNLSNGLEIVFQP